MPKTFVEWCTVIGFILVLWQLSSKPRDALKRQLLNRLATHSRTKTEKRIRELQAILSRIESLPVLTEFQDIVLRGFSGISFFLIALSLLAALILEILIDEPLIPPTPAIFFRDLLIVLLISLGVLMGVGMSRYFDKYRLDHSSEFRETIRKNIAELHARLK